MRRIVWQIACLLACAVAVERTALGSDLERCGRKTAEAQAAAVKALAEALKDPDVEVRRSAVLSLGRIGAGAEPATALGRGAQGFRRRSPRAGRRGLGPDRPEGGQRGAGT